MALPYSPPDVFTSDSAFGEGLPNAVGEAMSCSVLCMTTDVGDRKCLVGDRGSAVRLRDPGVRATSCHLILDAPSTRKLN